MDIEDKQIFDDINFNGITDIVKDPIFIQLKEFEDTNSITKFLKLRKDT